MEAKATFQPPPETAGSELSPLAGAPLEEREISSELLRAELHR